MLHAKRMPKSIKREMYRTLLSRHIGRSLCVLVMTIKTFRIILTITSTCRKGTMTRWKNDRQKQQHQHTSGYSSSSSSRGSDNNNSNGNSMCSSNNGFFLCLFSNRNGCVESYLGATDATFYTLQSTTFQMTGRCGKSVQRCLTRRSLIASYAHPLCAISFPSKKPHTNIYCARHIHFHRQLHQTSFQLNSVVFAILLFYIQFCLHRLPFGRPIRAVTWGFLWLCVPFAFAIKLGKTNGVKFMKLNFIHNLKMIIRYGTWNDGSRPPISFYLSPLSILLFLFRVSIIDESSKRFISKFTYTYVCTSYIVHTYTHSFHMHKLHFGGKNHNTHFQHESFGRV